MQDAPKAVWSIPFVSVAFFQNLKQNFIAYRSSKVSSRPDCIFEIHQLWQSGFSRVYSNYYCSCSFEAEIIRIGQSSHKMYSNNILNFQETRTILNACTKRKLMECITYLSFCFLFYSVVNRKGKVLYLAGSLFFFFCCFILFYFIYFISFICLLLLGVVISPSLDYLFVSQNPREFSAFRFLRQIFGCVYIINYYHYY